MAIDDARNLFASSGPRQLTAHGVESTRSPLAVASRFSLVADPEGQSRDYDRNGEHHGEGEEIPEVGDRECEVGRYEKEIEASDGQTSREEARTAYIPRRHQTGAEQIHHLHIGYREAAEHYGTERRAQGHDQRCPAVFGGRRASDGRAAPRGSGQCL